MGVFLLVPSILLVHSFLFLHRRDVQQVNMRVKSTPLGEEQAEEVQPTVVKSAKGEGTRHQLSGEQAAAKPTKKQSATRQSVQEPTTKEKSAGKPDEVQQDDEGSGAGDDGGDAEESTDSDVVEVQRGPRQSGQIWKPPEFYVPAAFTTAYDEVDDDLQYDEADKDEDFSELDPDMHADPEHRWDISTMTVKEALASCKGKAVKAAMEEIRNLVGMGTWELVERPPGVNIMKNRWVLTTKYHIDDTVEREKARLVVKGFTQVYGADYDETYELVSSYITLRIFLNIAAVFDLKLMQLDMKNAFLESKLDRVLYMYQPDYFNDGTDQVYKLLKSLYGLKQSPLLWYRALDVLVYVDDLLVARRNSVMLKELKELLEAAFELREILPVQKYLRLEIVHDRSAMKLWQHQQGYADKLRRQFLDEEQTGRTRKTPGIAFACSKLESGLIVRSDQHWREVHRCLAYLANTRDTALEFGGGAESLKVVGYVDAGDAGDRQKRTSTGGYVFVFGGAAQLDAGTPIVLRVDKKSAVTVAEGVGLTGNLKHMERRQAWLQHMVKHGKFSLRYIPTAEQPTDFLTKALHYPTFNWCSVAIGQVRQVDVGDGDKDVQQ
ncbi:unnamed protein product [Closterium sp. NIES-53]